MRTFSIWMMMICLVAVVGCQSSGGNRTANRAGANEASELRAQKAVMQKENQDAGAEIERLRREVAGKKSRRDLLVDSGMAKQDAGKAEYEQLNKDVTASEAKQKDLKATIDRNNRRLATIDADIAAAERDAAMAAKEPARQPAKQPAKPAAQKKPAREPAKPMAKEPVAQQPARKPASPSRMSGNKQAADKPVVQQKERRGNQERQPGELLGHSLRKIKPRGEYKGIVQDRERDTDYFDVYGSTVQKVQEKTRPYGAVPMTPAKMSDDGSSQMDNKADSDKKMNDDSSSDKKPMEMPRHEGGE